MVGGWHRHLEGIRTDLVNLIRYRLMSKVKYCTRKCPAWEPASSIGLCFLAAVGLYTLRYLRGFIARGGGAVQPAVPSTFASLPAVTHLPLSLRYPPPLPPSLPSQAHHQHMQNLWSLVPVVAAWAGDPPDLIMGRAGQGRGRGPSSSDLSHTRNTSAGNTNEALLIEVTFLRSHPNKG